MTRLFPPAAGPRIFRLPPGIDFSQALVAGLDERLSGQSPEAIARVDIWVNTQRARRALAEQFNKGAARLLPRIRVVTELADDPLAPLDLPAAVPDLRRRLELSRLVRCLIDVEPGLAGETAAFELAGSLSALMDEMQSEGIDPTAFSLIDPEDHAEHWQRNLRYLEILAAYIADAGISDGQGRMRAAAQAWGKAWAAEPPAHPVIIAGSTGSRGATREFMAAVARLPQGALILPGFDAGLTKAVWDRLGRDEPGAADHPQHGFRRLSEVIGFDPATLPAWHDVQPPSQARNELVSLALRPAPVTDQWRSEGGRLSGALSSALSDVTWIEASDPRAEARCIALVLREAAEAGTRAALISPDRVLTRRVAAELDRWSIIPDDSAGRPLALSPPGVLLRRLASLPGRKLTPLDLLILLKHPLTSSGAGSRGPHLDLTARLETEVLRGGAPHIDWRDLHVWARAAGGSSPSWIDWMHGALEPLISVGTGSLADFVSRHREVAEALAAGLEQITSNQLWEKEAGRRALSMIEDMACEADALDHVRPGEYRVLVNELLAERNVPEEAVVTDMNIAIWGTLEARVQTADLIVLGGLNDGTWPRLPGPDPWLNRALRAGIGLPAQDLQIGLSAHDFQQSAGAERVILSRALRNADAPTVASRWLMRLENLTSGLGEEGQQALAAAKLRGARLLAMAGQLDLPRKNVASASRPSPRPPLDSRPSVLSVTQIETLVRDPYAIYARKILDLSTLEPLGRQADALERGKALHAILETFLEVTRDGLPENARDVFRATLEDTLDRVAPWPAVRAFWRARLERAAGWFLAGEAERRERARPTAHEVPGKIPLAGLVAPFALTAKADRIDMAADGSCAIYDYKSGGVPSARDAMEFHLQLPLEAAIATAGGFEGLPPGPVFRLELLGLGARKSLCLDTDPETLTRTWERLHQLINHYQVVSNGYTARSRPGRITFDSDYDHLSRKGEWDDGDAPAPEVAK